LFQIASMNQRFPLLAAGALGATGVLFGALGAHILKTHLADSGMSGAWDMGVRYHLLHAVAILGIAGWMRPAPTGLAAKRAVWAVRWWVIGAILFSGSLYALALGAPRWIGAITPLGGLGLIAGWICAAGAALAPRSEYDI
jgi:uncharacterized membrane protein YgdD (TMEM256/DUF423 family)